MTARLCPASSTVGGTRSTSNWRHFGSGWRETSMNLPFWKRAVARGFAVPTFLFAVCGCSTVSVSSSNGIQFEDAVCFIPPSIRSIPPDHPYLLDIRGLGIVATPQGATIGYSRTRYVSLSDTAICRVVILIDEKFDRASVASLLAASGVSAGDVCLLGGKAL
jgi:hypothetical protein